MKRIRVLIVDDSAAVRDGLRSILGAHDDIDIVGTADDGVEAVAQVTALLPDVVLMDAQMPVLDGAGATRRIKREHGTTKVLFLTVHPAHLHEGLDAGADAALLKDTGRDDLLRALRELAGRLEPP